MTGDSLDAQTFHKSSGGKAAARGVVCGGGGGKEMGRDSWRVAVPCHAGRFGRPRRQINRAIAADQLFCGGDVLIAWTENFLHTGNRPCAISESGNRLGSADA